MVLNWLNLIHRMDASVQAAQIDDMISMGIKPCCFHTSGLSRQPQYHGQACKDAGVYVVNIDNVVQ